MKIVVVSVLCIVACNEIHAFMSSPLRVITVRSTFRSTNMNNFQRANGILKLKATDDKKGDLPSNDLPIDSEPYDGGSGDTFYKPYDRYKSPEVIDPNFLNGKSLFDIGTPKQRRAAMDPVRQSEWNAVNLFSQERGFLLAIVGVFLLALVYGSIFVSGGIDSSTRFSQSALDTQGCVLESDPRCRY